MANVYARISKITNAVGRSNYLTDEKRQEEIVLSKIEMQHSWSEHSSFENDNKKSDVKNNEGLEVHFALPNELYQDKKRLEKVCDEMVEKIVGHNKDYQYVVHWNHNRTNLHCHILFSERENQKDLIPKIYKKDQWREIGTNKLAKANSENAFLYAKKGDIQKDKEGNIKYETHIFTIKDKRYIEKNYPNTLRNNVKEVLNSHGYDLDITDKYRPYIAQKKLYKGANKDYIEKASKWNKEAKAYNKSIKEHIEIEPEQFENYMKIKKEVISNVREFNAEEKKITDRAIDLMHEMNIWAKNTLIQIKAYINSKVKELEVSKKWSQVKEKFSDMFSENKKIESNIKEMNQNIENYKEAYNQLDQIKESKEELIKDIEKSEKRRRYREEEYER